VTRNQDRAREFRRAPTEAEDFVWQELRGRAFQSLKFRRQFPLGNYIVDFVCLERRLIIELDGGQHNEPADRQYDAARDAWLRSQGFRVLRFWNNDVFEDWEAVAEGIWKGARDTPSPTTPLPPGERGEREKEAPPQSEAVAHRIRLAGIDAPQLAQPFGKKAREVLFAKVFLERSCTSERSSGSRTEQMSPQGTQECVLRSATDPRSKGALLDGSR